MKKTKYILFTTVILSFLFITACSTTKSIPQDDVYYSTTPHNVTARNTTTQQQKNAQANSTKYQQGKVENISKSSGQAVSDNQYDVDYSARLKRFHQSNDTSLDYYDDYYADRTTQDSSKQTSTTTIITSPSVSLNLGFGSPYFGSSWSFGFGYGGWNIGFGWGYPYYSWGYYPPYFGYYPPYYGYYPPYYGYYPPYYSPYYPPYYPGYPDYGYRAGVYQPRMNRGGGSSIPRGTVAGSSGIYTAHNTKSAGTAAAISHKRVPVNPENRDGKMVKPNGNSSRPAGSVRFSNELAKKRSADIHVQGKLSKPGEKAMRTNPQGNRSSRFGISESRNRVAESYHRPPAYQREASMPKPRFQKPKQYQSLESRSMRSSKEFYRAPARPSNPEYRRSVTRTVRPQQPQTVRRQNIFRPINTRNSVYRSNSRPRSSNIKVYNAPTRPFFSPNSFTPKRRSSTSTTRTTRSFPTAPTRHISAPVRINTGSGSGGSSIRRNSGSGGIRR